MLVVRFLGIEDQSCSHIAVESSVPGPLSDRVLRVYDQPFSQDQDRRRIDSSAGRCRFRRIRCGGNRLHCGRRRLRTCRVICPVVCCPHPHADSGHKNRCSSKCSCPALTGRYVLIEHSNVDILFNELLMAIVVVQGVNRSQHVILGASDVSVHGLTDQLFFPLILRW